MTNTPHPPAPLGAGGTAGRDARFDDHDESLNRFGGLDGVNWMTHRVITPQLLSGATSIGFEACLGFHHVLFSLLEQIGDFDGLIATPSVFVAGREELIDVARTWLVSHPAPTVGSERAERDHGRTRASRSGPSDDLARHSIDLATALGSEPSLTFGSIEAVTKRLIDDLIGVKRFYSHDDVDRLVPLGFTAVGCVARTTQLVGGAAVLLLDEGPSGPVVGR